jgi:hypothetical protein
VKISSTRPLTIQKDRRRATIFLNAYRIVGTIHLAAGGRVLDFVNYKVNEGPFIPLTEVSIYAVETGELLLTTEFLAVHRNQINFLTIDQLDPETRPAP